MHSKKNELLIIYKEGGAFMHRTTGFLLIFAMGFYASVESINLKGKVSNQSGRAIRNAVVTLLSKGLKDTTDANGAYTISDGQVFANPIPILPGAEKIALRNGSVILSLIKPSLVRIELFDMNGNLLKRAVNLHASAGDYQFDIMKERLAATMTAVRVAVDRHVSTFRYLPLHGGMGTLVTSSMTMSSTGSGLAKMQAAVDSLKVTASGYVTKAEPINSYEGEINITLDSSKLDKFSFFVTSLKALQELSGSQDGFGGNFSFGKTGQGAGLLGADSICACIAERSMPGSKVKQWRAFLSVNQGPDGKQVNAIDRIGQGPWYDRVGRLLSNNISELLNTRPAGADPEIKNDLPNEDGIPNHRPDPNGPTVDNHHFVTGSGTDGKLYIRSGSTPMTCNDWTSTTASGQPHCGFSWPRGGMGKTTFGGGGMNASHWISGFDCGGCKAGIHITSDFSGPNDIIGNGGGYGGFYCFALTP
jgi:hypothetical protein